MRRGRRTAICLAATLLVSAPATSPAGELAAEAGGVKVQVGRQPERPTTGRKTVYTVRLEDPAGTPVSGAKITLSGQMADGMSVVAPLRAAAEPGTYRGEVLYTMAGRWGLRVRVAGRSQRFEVPLVEEVDR